MFLRTIIFSIIFSALAMPAVAQNCNTKKPETTPVSRFINNGDGTITDKKTNKTWLACIIGMKWDGKTCTGQSLTYTWADSFPVIDEMNEKKVAGRSDWRLPKVEELMSIVEPRCFKPAINLDVFPYSPETAFWTDSSEDGFQPRVWVVHFLNGKQYIANKKQDWRIRLIAD